MKKPEFKLNAKWRRNKIDGSTQINEIAHDEEKKDLYVVFANDSIYQYHPFDAADYQKFVDAPSAGSHFHKFIKGNKKLTFKSKT